ncbi:3-hydroxybutyryl-CoA dehydrogenase [Pedobacter africanus]|uniref:3-hydroxybutyryl-CoA dehydrogenase n=1 Tax=Pedobacter africanus TaxID=151894 RepID=A0ACC6KRZ2_9SPHI|nr:3-hydroxyacyl-CoA dehydrogenase NAD-binding domain-containing protein [Pedobacter africanus]MDR6781976.1 3-hydroxybutyryl-CoA dehydrogenase [Pedobacter africanus]
MTNQYLSHTPVLVAGEGQLSVTLALCLAQAGHRVSLLTDEPAASQEFLAYHQGQLVQHQQILNPPVAVHHTSEIHSSNAFAFGIIVTAESLARKKYWLGKLEAVLAADAVIGVNTGAIPLTELQSGQRNPRRILGMNWCAPAHTTQFLEVIVNEQGNGQLAAAICKLATANWAKDPYIIRGETGIRARLFAAMAREAFFLLREDYATVEDIDRACRNDPGYYLPFAGNFRYMDLMGTYAYGLVMKELNPELAADTQVPAFFGKLVCEGHTGMASRQGFYQYEAEALRIWQDTFSEFSFQIRDLMQQYPGQFT